jgi:pyridoxamine 5'-phosphate oxidase
MINKNDFSENSIDPNPFVQFRTWYEEHLNCGIEIPDSVTLATAFADGRVSARTVLLKEYNETGFVFFTNYQSRKGIQLTSNPKAAMLFYWAESGRQVRIEGYTEKIPGKESESYFRTRPRESQLSALISRQSSIIPDRRYLDELYDTYKNNYSGKPVDKPVHWGGYRLIPEWFEFWQSGEFRLHDRLTYSKRKDLWVIERLAP